MNSFEELMKHSPIVAILRGITPAEVPAVCDALYENGIFLLEIPLNSPNALESISIAATHCAGKQQVGAGTVLTPEDVVSVYRAGGTFIISPNVNPEVIRETKRLGMLSMPGFFTATEGFAAIAAGADYLKLFPAVLGVGYIKDLQAVIRKPICAVGGVNPQNAADFLKVCAGIGIGSALYKPGRSAQEVGRIARELTQNLQ